MEIRTVSEELKKKYGVKIYRLALSSGCTCPNRDGTIGTGGCTFCSAGGSGDFASPFLHSIEEQIRLARKRVDAKIPSSIPEEKRRSESTADTLSPCFRKPIGISRPWVFP